MTGVQIEYLLGLYFVIENISFVTEAPEARAARVIRFILGVLLLIFAYMRLSLIG